MPAPPSTAQKAANQASMNAAKASVSKSVSNGSPSSTRTDRAPSPSNSRSGGGISTPTASGSPTNNPTGISRSSSQAVKSVPSRGLLGMGGTRGSFTAPSAGLLGSLQRTGISTPNASGSPFNNPASLNVTPGNGSLKNAMTQRQAVNSMAPQAVAPGQRVTDVFGPNYAMDPSITGRNVESLWNSIGQPGIQSIIDQKRQAAPQNFQSTLGYQAPQPQQSGIFNRALSDSQLGNPMSSPNTLGYRAAVKAAEHIGGNPQNQIDNTFKALGMNDVKRAGLMGRLAVESNYFDPDVLAADKKFDKGRSVGLAQWRDVRLPGVKDFVGSIDSPLSSPAAQAAGVINEMQFKEKKAYGMLNNAKTLPEAMKAMNQYERQQDWNTKNPLGQKEAMAWGDNYLSNPPTQPSGPTQIASINPASYTEPAPSTNAGYGVSPSALPSLATMAVSGAQALVNFRVPDIMGSLNEAAGYVKQYAEAQPGIGITRSISQKIVANEAQKAIAQAAQAITGWQSGVLSQVAAAEALQKAQKATAQIAAGAQETDPSMWEQTTPAQQASTATPQAPIRQAAGTPTAPYDRTKVQQVADAIMNFMPGGAGGATPRRSDGYGLGNGNASGGESNTDGNGAQTPPVTPPAQPPVNPMTAWMYPQYSQQWAGLPTGIGGYARG